MATERRRRVDVAAQRHGRGPDLGRRCRAVDAPARWLERGPGSAVPCRPEDGVQLAQRLPAILDGAGALPAAPAADSKSVEYGRTYAASPNQHLYLHRVAVGPRENGSRPA